MHPVYVAKLGLQVRKTIVKAQKIDGSPLKTFEIVLASFSVQNKLEKTWFFQKIFLLANTSIKVVLEMAFLIFSGMNVCFAEKKLKQRNYTAAKALPTT